MFTYWEPVGCGIKPVGCGIIGATVATGWDGIV